MSIVLEVKNLTHTYGNSGMFVNDAISDINFAVNCGEIIGIIGHTGSGKSTLVQHLNGLLKPTNGEILIEGANIWDDPKKIYKVRSKVGLVFQYPEYQLFEETVYLDIAFGPKNMGLSEQDIKTRIYDICSLLGIPEEYLEKSPFDLSGGEKRRVAIAGVMAMQPQIIIFDEPIAGLDPKGRNEVIKMIADYRKAYNATVIIISHNMEDMALLADKLLVLNKGKVEMFDTVQNVFSNYEKLKQIGLSVPIVTEIMRSIKQKYPKIRDDIYTVDEAVKYLSDLSKGGGADA